ncbi:MAG: HPF/RaiA family ribosome-associated protein [Mollicutes bacterium]|nr:MAG: HPF/RaiA family ribosome-associated protein [Mollicutes bacterium]
MESEFKLEVEKKIAFLQTKYNFFTESDELHLNFELFKELKCGLKAELFLFKLSKRINMHTKDDNVYKAIHQIINKIDAQLIKVKEKLDNH